MNLIEISKLFIPENEFDIREGYYSNDDIAELLRLNKNFPDVIQFIADMVEDGEGSTR